MRTLIMSMALVATLTGCLGPSVPHGSLRDLYPSGPRPQLLTSHFGTYTLNSARMSEPGPVDVLFVHGSPGDWEAWAHYLSDPRLQSLGTLIAVDRPGFGASGPGHVMPDLRAQAALLAQLLPKDRPTVVVGHSLGGPIAAWLALDQPQKVCGTVMVAGSFAAAYESPRWYNRLATTWLARLIIPDVMRWSNEEIMPLQAQLEILDRHWPALSQPLLAIQGEQDDLVDPRTVNYLRTRVKPALLTVDLLPNAGHFIPWEHRDVVVDAIRSMSASCVVRAAGISSTPALARSP